MTSPANDTSELTAYALGELQAHQAGAIHSLLTACPAATSELEQIEAVTEALRQRAPIPQDRLQPDQRHAVLYPTQIPRRVAPMMPRPMVKKTSQAWPVMSILLKAAALFIITGAAFFAGRQVSLIGTQLDVAQSQPVPAKPAPISKPAAPAKVEVAVVKPTPAPAASVSAPQPAPILEKAAIAAIPAPVKPEVIVAKTEPVKAAQEIIHSAPELKPVVPLAVNRLNREVAFISTNQQAADRFSIKPADIRPLPVKGKDKEQFASPLKGPAPKIEEKKQAQGIYIHSWKTETTSCPWNPSTRLLRVTILLPADQPAATASTSYPLDVNFDRRNVREFRRLTERHLPAAELRSAGTQVVWYEFQPAANELNTPGKTIATVTLDQARFTTQTVGPFDESKLNVVDRGATWQTAREDYLFESAVIGLGMLLNGDHQSPNLNHQLILDLAEKSKGSDSSGERGRFIRQLNDARRAAGL
jgi:anti-sigma factor RsiW